MWMDYFPVLWSFQNIQTTVYSKDGRGWVCNTDSVCEADMELLKHHMDSLEEHMLRQPYSESTEETIDTKYIKPQYCNISSLIFMRTKNRLS